MSFWSVKYTSETSSFHSLFKSHVDFPLIDGPKLYDLHVGLCFTHWWKHSSADVTVMDRNEWF